MFVKSHPEPQNSSISKLLSVMNTRDYKKEKNVNFTNMFLIIREDGLGYQDILFHRTRLNVSLNREDI